MSFSYIPKDEMELVFLKSLFEAEGIPYFVQNDYFGSLRVGPVIEHYNSKTILVPDEFETAANEVLALFLENAKAKNGTGKAASFSFWDRLRMIAEVLLFGWFVPGKRPNKNDD